MGAGSAEVLDFDAFYLREYPSALRLAWSLTGNRAVAEELCQDAFLAAHRRWSRIAGYDAPALWVRRVVTNRCLSVLRRRGIEARASQLESSAEASMVPALPDHEVWAAVRALPRRQAQAVTLVYAIDMSQVQAAKTMRCSPETLRTHLTRALRTLADVLHEDFEEVDP